MDCNIGDGLKEEVCVERTGFAQTKRAAIHLCPNDQLEVSSFSSRLDILTESSCKHDYLVLVSWFFLVFPSDNFDNHLCLLIFELRKYKYSSAFLMIIWLFLTLNFHMNFNVLLLVSLENSGGILKGFCRLIWGVFTFSHPKYSILKCHGSMLWISFNFSFYNIMLFSEYKS